MKNICIIVACFFTLSLLFAACAETDTPQPTVPETNIETTQPIQSVSHISDIVSHGDKSLVLDAEILYPENIPAAEIVLLPDLEQPVKMADDFGLTLELDNDVHESKYTMNDENGNTIRSLTSDKSGCIQYLDIENNINPSRSIDVNHQFDSYYVTENIPKGMKHTGLEVATDIAIEFEKYSCFTFIPWNVCAYEASEGQPDQSCYSVQLMPVYDGIPVSIHSNVQNLTLWVNAKVSNIGIFAFQGTFAFKHEKTSEKSQPVALDCMIQNLSENFNMLITGEKLTIERISIQYYAQQDKNGCLVLRPVWVFEGSEYMSSEVTGYEPIVEQFAAVYWADTGALLDIFNGKMNTTTVN